MARFSTGRSVVVGIDDTDVDAGTVLDNDRAAEALLKHAAEADLMVLGSHVEGRSARMLPGRAHGGWVRAVRSTRRSPASKARGFDLPRCLRRTSSNITSSMPAVTAASRRPMDGIRHGRREAATDHFKRLGAAATRSSVRPRSATGRGPAIERMLPRRTTAPNRELGRTRYTCASEPCRTTA
jgi:hypothetical protein